MQLVRQEDCTADNGLSRQLSALGEFELPKRGESKCGPAVADAGLPSVAPVRARVHMWPHAHGTMGPAAGGGCGGGASRQARVVAGGGVVHHSRVRGQLADGALPCVFDLCI